MSLLIPRPTPAALDRGSGVILFLTVILAVVAEWGGRGLFGLAAGAGAAAYLAVVAWRVSWSGRVFVGVGLTLAAVAAATRAEWAGMLTTALGSAAFIAAFYVSLAWLRNAAGTSPMIETCGRFLAEQGPRRRYLALTAGGHLFGLVLNLGAIALLGSLAENATRREPDPEIRAIRTRRMLLAVQRGFIATLCWSPLSFSLAIATSIVPNATWAAALPYCLVSAFVLATLGWVLDSLLKPKPSRALPDRPPAHGSWADLTPLLGLLAVLMAAIIGLQTLTGVRAVAVIMVVAPTLSIAWIVLQVRRERSGRLAHAGRRAVHYVGYDLADYRGDLVLLMMAGFIGTLGAALLAPVVARSGLDLTVLPAWVLLVALVWMVPLAGQIGMNPILFVSLVAPLLPEAGATGIPPVALIAAMTAGWALSGASSPFTATTLFVGTLAGVGARHVGLKWNGLYTLLGGAILSVWVAVIAGL